MMTGTRGDIPRATLPRGLVRGQAPRARSHREDVRGELSIAATHDAKRRRAGEIPLLLELLGALKAGRRRDEDRHARADLLVPEVDVAAQHAADVPRLADHVPERVGVHQHLLVEPTET